MVTGVQTCALPISVADAAGEFETALGESQYVSLRIVDWFHIAMKFRVAQLSASGVREQLPDHWEGISMRLERAKWRLWHGWGAPIILAGGTTIVMAGGEESKEFLMPNVDPQSR